MTLSSIPLAPARKRRFRSLLATVWLALAVGLLGACGTDERAATDDSPATGATEPLRVLAAASLTDVVTALAESYDGPVATSFGASSSLARQIRDGAPADVFLSASPRWIEYLRQADALAGEPVVLARGRLVAVAPRDSELANSGIGDARTLLDHLAEGDGVAIADAGVPAGEYARAALASGGVLDAFQPHLVGQSDVRAVLHAVGRGELRAGFVYASDARSTDAAHSASARVSVLFVFAADSHPAIEYQAAALRGASDAQAAQEFLAHLLADGARRQLADAGFSPP